MMNRQIVLRSRPESNPTADNFELASVALPPVTDGAVLRRTIYLSLDPYMRGRMRDAKSYAAPVELGEVMTGGAVGEVVRSNHPGFKVGDIVEDTLGWQEYAVGPGRAARRIDPAHGPISRAALASGRTKISSPPTNSMASLTQPMPEINGSSHSSK